MKNLNLYGFVYVLRRGELVKIGRTQHPEKRIRQLETAAGAKLDRVAIFRTYAPAACERHLLRKVRPWITHGEWFHFPDGDGFEMVRDYLSSRATRVELPLIKNPCISAEG